MNLQIKLKDFLSLEFIVLFLCAIEFMSKFYSLIFLLFLLLFLKSKVRPSSLRTINFYYILLFSISYLVFSYKDIPTFIVPIWLVSYIIGYTFADKVELFFKTWLLIAVGIAIHSYLIFTTNTSNYGVDSMGNRIMFDIWGGGYRGATALVCSFLLGCSMIVPLFCYIRKKIWAIAYCIFMIYAFVYGSIMTASRSALIYPIIIIFLSSMPLLKGKNKTTMLLIVMGIVAIIVGVYLTDFLQFRSFFERQFLYERFVEKEGGGVIHNQRLGLWEDLYYNMGDYIFGGAGEYRTVSERRYVHNFLLDIFATGGIFPFIFLLLLTIRFIKTIIKIYKSNNDFVIRSTIIGIASAFLLIFMSEPIIQAANWFFCFFLLFIGCLDRKEIFSQRINI